MFCTNRRKLLLLIAFCTHWQVCLFILRGHPTNSKVKKLGCLYHKNWNTNTEHVDSTE